MPTVQFSLRGLFLLIAVVSVYFALRQACFAGHEFYVVAQRAHLMPPLFALGVVVLCTTCLSIKRMRGLVFIGAGTSLVIASVLLIEIAEVLRRDYHYWNWRDDLPKFFLIVGTHTAIGALLGLGVAAIVRMTGQAPQRKSRKGRKDPNDGEACASSSASSAPSAVHSSVARPAAEDSAQEVNDPPHFVDARQRHR